MMPFYAYLPKTVLKLNNICRKPYLPIENNSNEKNPTF